MPNVGWLSVFGRSVMEPHLPLPAILVLMGAASISAH